MAETKTVTFKDAVHDRAKGTYSYEKKVDGKSATISFVDVNKDCKVDSKDSVKITGDSSIFTADEIKSFLASYDPEFKSSVDATKIGKEGTTIEATIKAEPEAKTSAPALNIFSGDVTSVNFPVANLSLPVDTNTYSSTSYMNNELLMSGLTPSTFSMGDPMPSLIGNIYQPGICLSASMLDLPGFCLGVNNLVNALFGYLTGGKSATASDSKPASVEPKADVVAEAPKAEVPKVEEPKKEVPVDEAAKAEAAKAEAEKAEAAKKAAETKKAEEAKKAAEAKKAEETAAAAKERQARLDKSIAEAKRIGFPLDTWEITAAGKNDAQGDAALKHIEDTVNNMASYFDSPEAKRITADMDKIAGMQAKNGELPGYVFRTKLDKAELAKVTSGEKAVDAEEKLTEYVANIETSIKEYERVSGQNGDLRVQGNLLTHLRSAQPQISSLVEKRSKYTTQGVSKELQDRIDSITKKLSSNK